MRHTYIFDLDGVIYRGSEPQPDAKETVERLRSTGQTVFFLTNNSTLTRQQYAHKLTSMGIPTSPAEMMTSAYAAALYLEANGGRGKKAYVVGEQGIRVELEGVGVEVISEGRADFVVAGLDKQFTYEKLLRAHQAILGGAQFVATNKDATYPLEGGLVIPGGGSIIAAIETAAGVAPVVIGKPETYAVKMVLQAAGSRAENAVMIGDRIETDILAGKRVGAHTVLVLTGVSSREDAEQAPPEMRPDRIIERLGELLEACTDDCRV